MEPVPEFEKDKWISGNEYGRRAGMFFEITYSEVINISERNKTVGDKLSDDFPKTQQFSKQPIFLITMPGINAVS